MAVIGQHLHTAVWFACGCGIASKSNNALVYMLLMELMEDSLVSLVRVLSSWVSHSDQIGASSDLH